uniref:CAS1 domain-containing protein 1 n=1 Tax=Anthurium amnicola TaxID=1678845 RepID=A0A1D1YQB2_9ARAE
MDRQRSFSFKPSELLLFSFAISFSLFFCLLFSLWGLRNPYPSVRETHGVQTVTSANGNSSDGAAKGITVSEETRFIVGKSSAGGYGFAQRNKSTILGDTHLSESTGPSVEAPQGVWKKKDAVLADTHFKIAAHNSEKSAYSVEKRGNISLSESYQGAFDDSSRQGVAFSDGGLEGDGQESEVPKVGEGSSIVGNSVNSGFGGARTDGAMNSGIPLVKKTERETGFTCDVSRGKWVLDELYPLYKSNSCPFIDEGFDCESTGRLDKDYMKWRWQPHGCNIPRFDALKMLELIRGKRLVFVGDSLNRNQWESMLCLLSGAVDLKRVHEAHGRKITKEKGNYNFKFVDYRCSVEYYVTHYLVHEGKARIGTKRRPTLRIDAIDRGSSKWRGADILVFNTAHWWSHYKTKAGVNYYQEGAQVHPHLDFATAFRRALTTWASWVDKHVNPGKTRVFFRTSAPSHFRGGEWNSGGHCKESTQPLNETMSRSSPEMNIIVEEVIKQMGTPVTLLNITGLSGLRIDGHPSIHGRNPGRGPLQNIQDCSHWCLPGVPDTWNELLYFYLLSKQKTASIH